MRAPFDEPTYRVSELARELRGFVKEAYSSVWLRAEVERLRTSQRGHVYLELVEKGAGDQVTAKLDAVIWGSDWAAVSSLLRRGGQRLADGLEIRCRGGLDFWPPGGRLQFVVREVDPVFTLGLLEQRRRETLEALTRDGLLELNRQHVLPEVPLSVALVTSEGSAAYHDFLSSLAASGYGFRVLFVHTAVQGREAEREITSALAALAGSGVDCAALVRGGGARTDLAVFDSRAVAEAVARAPFPVFTGLGHEIDRSITDRVAHTALKTPTMVAEHLVEKVAAAETAVEQLRRRLRREAREPLAAAERAVERAERGLKLARLRLDAAGLRLAEAARALARLGRGRLRRGESRLEGLTRALASRAPRFVERRKNRPEEVARHLVALAQGRLAAARATLGGHARLCAQLAPERTLERGFSITRLGDGRLLRHASDAASGETLLTRLADGTVRSRVE